MKHFHSCLWRLGHATIALTFLVSCNPEEYYPLLETVEGVDRFCSLAKDETSCRELSEKCQPAFLDLEVDTEEPVFSSCIANPVIITDPSELPQDEGIITDPETTDLPPTFSETIINGCQNLTPDFLHVKTVTQKKSTKVITKVKLCHNTTHLPHTILIPCPALKAHAKHQEEGDYLGACKIE